MLQIFNVLINVDKYVANDCRVSNVQFPSFEISTNSSCFAVADYSNAPVLNPKTCALSKTKNRYFI